MRKLPLFALFVFVAVLSLTFVSAYDGYYYPSHSGYNSYPDGYSYYEKTTYTTEKRVVERSYPIYPVYNDYYYVPNRYAPIYKYTYPSYSNYRYDRTYVYDRDYSYDKPYYYAPRFDSNLGYYNWRY